MERKESLLAVKRGGSQRKMHVPSSTSFLPQRERPTRFQWSMLYTSILEAISSAHRVRSSLSPTRLGHHVPESEPLAAGHMRIPSHQRVDEWLRHATKGSRFTFEALSAELQGAREDPCQFLGSSRGSSRGHR